MSKVCSIACIILSRDAEERYCVRDWRRSAFCAELYTGQKTGLKTIDNNVDTVVATDKCKLHRSVNLYNFSLKVFQILRNQTFETEPQASVRLEQCIAQPLVK